MAQYIDKDIVVAEIEKRIADNKKDIERASHKNLEDYFEGYEDALALFKQQFLDTLEVKEVDFGIEVYKYIDEHFNVYDDGNQTLQTKDKKTLIGRVDVENIAKHFFELGVRVNNPITAADRGTAEEINILRKITALTSQEK